MDKSTLRLFYWNITEKKWIVIENSGVDTEKKEIHANVTHLTLFAPFGVVKEEKEGFSFGTFALGILIGFIILLLGIFTTKKGGLLEKLKELPEKIKKSETETPFKPETETTQIIEPKELPQTTITISSLSDVGKSRDHNEDSLLVLKKESDTDGKRAETALLVVADGMGGHAKGEVASQMAAKALSDTISPLWGLRIKPEKSLRKGISEAEKRIQQKMSQDSSCQGMGTTVVTSLIVGDNLYIGNVGDSRCYLVRKREIRQLTKDHSLVQEMVDRGEITQSEAQVHPQKNVITNVVGAIKNVKIDIFKEKLQNNDRILLTSDGLVGELEDNEIREIILKNKNPKKACKELVRMANERGGGDNITVIVAKIKIAHESTLIKKP